MINIKIKNIIIKINNENFNIYFKINIYELIIVFNISTIKSSQDL